MQEEFEKTYLAKYLPKDLKKFPSREIIDIYIPGDRKHPCMRVRKGGDSYEITKKKPIVEGDCSIQSEETIKLDEGEFKFFESIKSPLKKSIFCCNSIFPAKFSKNFLALAPLKLQKLFKKFISKLKNFATKKTSLMDSGKKIKKERFYYKKDGVDFEVDIFKDGLEGLVLVDVEFKNEKSKNDFKEIPDFCLAEITQEDFIAGGMLAGKKYSDIENDLVRYKYKKL